MYIVRFYDKSGTPLGEYPDAIELKRNWALNKFGTCNFKIPTNHPLCRRDVLAQGNRIVVFSTADVGLEPWGGWVAKARDWEGKVVTVTCQGTASILQDKRLIPSHDMSGALAHEHFSAIINAANNKEHTGIILGELYTGGTTYDISETWATPYKLLEELNGLCQYDFDFTYIAPSIWAANLYEKKGTNRTKTIVLQHGIDIVGEPKYSEDEGETCNYVYALGDAPQQGGEQLKVEYGDDASIQANGLAEGTITCEGVTNADTLMQRAIAHVEANKSFKRTLSITINNTRGFWKTIREGDIVAVHIPNYGFTGLRAPIHVLGREPDEAKGTMEIVAEVVDGEEAGQLEMQLTGVDTSTD